MPSRDLRLSSVRAPLAGLVAGLAAGAVASVQGLGMVIGPMVGTLLYRAAPSAPYLLVGAVLLGLAAVATLHGRRPA